MITLSFRYNMAMFYQVQCTIFYKNQPGYREETTDYISVITSTVL